MNYAIILAAGVGHRMRSGGLPKQLLKLMGKPIIVYTLEKFQESSMIDRIILVSHPAYTEEMESLVEHYKIRKVVNTVIGGVDRRASLEKGLAAVIEDGAKSKDIIVVHDGVRPLVEESTIHENIRIAKKYHCAITVRPVTETVVITEDEEVGIEGFRRRDNTYSLTSPQTFEFNVLKEALAADKEKKDKKNELPLLDAGMIYADTIGPVHLVKENNANIKITTPEDYYYLKAILELEENKYIFGL